MGNNPYSIAAVRTAFATLIMWAQTLDISFYQWRSWKSCSYEGKHVRRIKSCSTAQIAEILGNPAAMKESMFEELKAAVRPKSQKSIKKLW
ncbi:hypothetical protein QE152_g10087 [Popillia japonica]|uniref:Uncharacterized protein n=1 Tax=Popillia japonica TaxID=7064 RepID=A0AAW1LSP4_POPJA